MKVDNHIHLAAAMTPRMLLAPLDPYRHSARCASFEVHQGEVAAGTAARSGERPGKQFRGRLRWVLRQENATRCLKLHPERGKTEPEAPVGGLDLPGKTLRQLVMEAVNSGGVGWRDVSF